MPLTFTVLRCPNSVAPETRTVSGGEYTVGRGPGVDWVLPDPERLLSKHHFAVAYRGGSWQVADTSTNGTYMNTEADPIGRNEVRTLRDGDRLKLGAYEIEIRLAEEAMQPAGGGFGYGGGRPASPFGDPFGADPLAPPPPPPTPFGEPAYPAMQPQGSAQLPHDFDPLSPDHSEEPFQGVTHSDHSPLMEDAFRPPAVTGQMPMTGGKLPGDDLLPDDWDKDLLEGIAAPGASPAQQPQPAQPVRPTQPAPAPAFAPQQPQVQAFAPQPAPAPVQPSPAQPFPHPSADPFAQPVVQPMAAPVAPAPVQPAPQPAPHAQPFVESLQPAAHPAQPFVQPVVQPAAPAIAPHAPTRAEPANPFDEPFDLSPEPAPPVAEPLQPGPAAVRPVHAPPTAAVPFEEPFEQAAPFAEPPRPAPAARPSVPAGAPAGVPADTALLAAFLEGVGMADAHPADPAATMRALGEAFRTLVSGLRSVLIARASIKSEFRIEQTMIRARGNNPLKFSAGDDDALSALLGTGRRTDMTPAAAVADALKDIRLHELATMAAMQSAVRTLLDNMSPDKLRAQAEQGGGLSVLPAQRKARAWDTFETLHAKTVQALSDDFDSVFGKAFARAYEQAMDDVSAKER